MDGKFDLELTAAEERKIEEKTTVGAGFDFNRRGVMIVNVI
jgi:hypothetical protein